MGLCQDWDDDYDLDPDNEGPKPFKSGERDEDNEPFGGED